MTDSPPAGNLATSVLLSLWERGADWHPLDQALLLLQTADPHESFESLSAWTIGQRDRRLLELRRDIFGDSIDGYAECPSCRNGLEFKLSCDELLAGQGGEHHEPTRVVVNGLVWECRAPNSSDVAAVLRHPNMERTARELLLRCARLVDGATEAVAAWDQASYAPLVQQLATLDPLAEILIDLKCPACGHSWQCLFDIATFLWSEVRAHSRRVLQEIDVLARTYGWTECEILELSDHRRRLYVQMVLA